jgi:hypothetical protein
MDWIGRQKILHDVLHAYVEGIGSIGEVEAVGLEPRVCRVADNCRQNRFRIYSASATIKNGVNK